MPGVLVNGRPWHLRIAVRAFAHKSGADGRDVYNNRVVDFVELRWGRILRWEAYEDTERSAAWDAAHDDRNGLVGAGEGT